jgi:hypothetical protein
MPTYRTLPAVPIADTGVSADATLPGLRGLARLADLRPTIVDWPRCPECGKPAARKSRRYCSLGCVRIAQGAGRIVRKHKISEQEHEAHFWERVRKTSPDQCWEWTGSKNIYGIWCYWHPDGKWVSIEAHRYLWKIILEREIPPGHNVHHVCESKFCVNPDHLELLTDAEHCRRHKRTDFFFNLVEIGQATHCLNGHEFTPENTYWDRSRKCRKCRTCYKISHLQYRENNRESLNARRRIYGNRRRRKMGITPRGPGEGSSSSKLKEIDVRQILFLRNICSWTCKQIAAQFRIVTVANIRAICAGKSWKYLQAL